MLLTVQKSLCCTAFESIESANSLCFLGTALSIESTGLSIESVPFYIMAGFLGIPRKRIFLESAEHIILTIAVVVASSSIDQRVARQL